MTSPVSKQQCSICGSPDHTHLHCYGMQAQGAISSNECGWLIEWPADDNVPVRWWHPVNGWMRDASKGVRFSRKQDAEAYISAGKFCSPVVATEHAWGFAPETSPQWTCSCGHVNTTPKLFMDRCSHCGEHRGSVEETYTNESPPHPPILPERFNSVSLPEKASGEPIYECCNESCLWRGLESETVHPKHEPSRFLCPECHEVVELV